MRKKRYTLLQLEHLLDGVRDEIDEALHSIQGKKARVGAARDLIEYLELHHIGASSSS